MENDGLGKQPCLVKIVIAEELSGLRKFRVDDFAFPHGEIRVDHGKNAMIVDDEDPIVGVEGADPHVAFLPVLIRGG